jgi:ribulose-5-phosphate 4-epimerase/fuculose-1-phosphate aldolase
VSGDEEGRTQVIRIARSLFDRGLVHGRTGNISVRVDGGILMTPTGASLGTIERGDLSLVNDKAQHLSGPKPSKEAFLHAAMLRARPAAGAVIHTHSTYCAAVSCLGGLDEGDAIPPLTAYFAMRIGRLPLLPYHAPGDDALGPLAEDMAREHAALLLANHGPVVAGGDLSEAFDSLEELEQTAKIFLVVRGAHIRPLASDERTRLSPSFTPDETTTSS